MWIILGIVALIFIVGIAAFSLLILSGKVRN